MNVSPKGWKFQTLHPIWNSENQMSESEVHPVDIKQRAMLLASHKGAVTAQSTIAVFAFITFQTHENDVATTVVTKKRQLDHQIVPTGGHEINPAERRAVQTFKSHFTSIIDKLDAKFSSDAWDHPTPQTNMTLNVLRPCDVNVAHSTCSHLHGTFDFGTHPPALLGCRSTAHES